MKAFYCTHLRLIIEHRRAIPVLETCEYYYLLYGVNYKKCTRTHRRAPELSPPRPFVDWYGRYRAAIPSGVSREAGVFIRLAAAQICFKSLPYFSLPSFLRSLSIVLCEVEVAHIEKNGRHMFPFFSMCVMATLFPLHVFNLQPPTSVHFTQRGEIRWGNRMRLSVSSVAPILFPDKQ